MRVWRGLLLATLLALAGCANWNAVYRTKTVASSGPRVITIDAKQREVLMVPDVEGTPGNWTRTGQWRVCAEAAPDVFSVLAASASGALKADIAGKSGELRAALAITESAATIERTQTVNLLRESMYRTCERYMSHAINKSAFVVQAGRDWKAMIAILAIEQLTRSARPPATVIVAGGTSATVENTSGLVSGLNAAQTKKNAAEASRRAADNAVAAAGVAKCEGLTEPAEKVALCRTQADAKAQEAVAGEELKAWHETTRTHPDPDQAEATTDRSESKAGGNEQQPSRIRTSVATVVGDIALEALRSNEMQLFCVQYIMDPPTAGMDPDVKTRCLNHLEVVAQYERSLLSSALENQDNRRAAMSRIEIAFSGADYLAAFLGEISDTEFATEISQIAAATGGGSICAGLSRRACITELRLTGLGNRLGDQVIQVVNNQRQARKVH